VEKRKAAQKKEEQRKAAHKKRGKKNATYVTDLKKAPHERQHLLIAVVRGHRR
jgi:hypothetical protein